MALIGYGRVSTDEQTTILQEDALRAAGCEKLFIEKISGTVDPRERPELSKALEYLRTGDVFVVWRMDRLARSLKDLIETITGLEARGVAFRSLTESIDASTAAGKLIFHVFGALAEFERQLTVERTRAGLKAARARGRMGGRRQTLTADHLEDAAMLIRKGRTPDQVAERLGVSRATLYSYLPDGGTTAVRQGAGLLAKPRQREDRKRLDPAKRTEIER